MRTLEYLLLTAVVLVIALLVITPITHSIADSLNDSAAMIANAGGQR